MRAYTAVALAVATLCAACTSIPSKDEVDAKHAEMAAELLQRNAEIAAVPEDRALVSRAKGAWLGVKVKPLAQDVNLPSVFRTTVTMNYPGRYNLRAIAEKITKTTGIPVSLKPDVFMPLSSLVSGGQGGAGAAAAGITGPGVAGLANNVDEMELNFVDVPLKDILNQVNSRMGVNATFTENEGLTFSRFVTRTMTVKANPGNSTLTASLGKGGSSGGGSAGASGGAAFNSDGKVSMESNFSVWTSIEGALNTIKSPPGKFIINQASGSVTMTDTKEIVDIAQRYIDGENAIMTRQVAVRVELLSVTSNDNRELGVNWNGVFTKLNGLIPQWNVNLVAPASINSSSVGGVGMTILAPPKACCESTLSQFKGTEAMINALQGFARITNRQSFAAMTLNRQPAPIAKTIQTTYLARTTPGGNAGTGSSTLPGLEPGQVTTGFMSNILPTVLDNDTVMLQFSIDSSELTKLESISTGANETLQRIQTPEVGAVQTVQKVALRSGGTLVLTGFDREVMQYDQRGLTKQIGLGGSYNGSKVRETYVILVTPIIVDGA